MTNWDKFKDQITTTGFAVSRECKIDCCGEIRCENCLFAVNKIADCSESRIKWLKDKYNDKAERIAELKIDIYERMLPTWDGVCNHICSKCPFDKLNSETGLRGKQTCNAMARTIIFAGIDAVLKR